ncbi:MAG: UDP-N-acetylglucosamine--N-acetylmuramyl-(pentapeptide) pyrophosphoryl-undecaprenol N-acetylglucosamine transferase [Kiritimatiellae bacterium]|nr:UDP-N-acetylglucosamine--N-acetylmuramyl-(pentapeptide) pyrophosphoryl-undecaprenol N-acetylglucosamine transferase [Kiritimatiellia bacterium]
MPDKKRFVVACGGTGGHVFPGLAVANALRERGHEVTVWLSGRDIEQSTLGSWDGPVFATGARQLSLRNSVAMLKSFFRCLKELKANRPDALLAMGSYSSLPPVMAAKFRRVPVMLHEANAVPGKAVDFLARFADFVAISFKETAKCLTGRETVFTGLPVRKTLCGQAPFDNLPKGAFVLLVTGGSQGAHRVNELVSKALCLLKKHGAHPFYVIHQCGKNDVEWLEKLYQENGVPGQVSAFIPEMGRAYASADFVVSRAGASTCFELCLLGKPALLIPLPQAVRNHQHLNATALVTAGAADEGSQNEMTEWVLMRYLDHKIADPEKVREMSQKMLELAVPDAAERVAQALEKLAGRSNKS